MKIRQAKKLLTKWGRWELPFEMRTKVIKASRYSYRHRANCHRKKMRALASTLDGSPRFMSIPFSPRAVSEYLAWMDTLLAQMARSLGIPRSLVEIEKAQGRNPEPS